MIRSNGLVLGAVALGLVGMAGTARATFVSDVLDPFLNSRLEPGGTRVSDPVLGFVAYSVTNIQKTGSVLDSGILTLTYSATPVLTFYETATSVVPLGSAALTGQFTVQIPGGSEPFFLNSVYDLRLTSSTATGTINGVPVSVRLIDSPLFPSVGETYFTPGPGDLYTVDTTLTQYSEFSIGDAPFLPLPPIESTGVQGAVPEPASLAALGLATLALVRRRRR